MTGHAEVQHRFVEANGLRFHVASCGEERGERLALCLHGFPELWLSWRHQLPLLARLGWRAWAPDLRGYGESERPPQMRAYALEHLLRDVAGLIDASGARRVLLVGHDWGGIIAWYFAMRRLRPLERLVVLNAPHPAAYEREMRTFGQLRRSWYGLFFQLPWLPERLLTAGRARGIGRLLRRSSVCKEAFPDDVIEAYRSAATRPGAARAMLDYYRALVRGGGGARQSALGYPPIEVPTLHLWGEQDIALRRELALGLEPHVKDLTLRFLPGSSHWVHQDPPEPVNAMLEAWLLGRNVPDAAAVAKAGRPSS